METNIRYQFREVYGITQAKLAEWVTELCKEDGTGYSCSVPDISHLMDKVVRGASLTTPKENVIHGHLLDILEELKNGKTWS